MRAIFGIFWPEEGQAKKSPKQPEGQNMPGAKTVFFVILNHEKCRAFTHELHFSIHSKFFPLQKVNLAVLKIPIGQ